MSRVAEPPLLRPTPEVWGPGTEIGLTPAPGKKRRIQAAPGGPSFTTLNSSYPSICFALIRVTDFCISFSPCILGVFLYFQNNFLCCVGTSHVYSHSAGLGSQPGFMSSSKFLLPWEVPLTKVNIFLYSQSAPATTLQGSTGMLTKKFFTSTSKFTTKQSWQVRWYLLYSSVVDPEWIFPDSATIF